MKIDKDEIISILEGYTYKHSGWGFSWINPSNSGKIADEILRSVKKSNGISPVVRRSLHSMNLANLASLDSLARDLGWELINECNGTIKINLNPNSEFEKRVSYVVNKYDRSSLSRECPYQIYLYLKDEGFDV